jgi:hypothetical protein
MAAVLAADGSPAFGQVTDRNQSHGPIPNLASSGNAADPAQLQSLAERLQAAEQWDQLQQLLQKSHLDPQAFQALQKALQNPDPQKKQEQVLQALSQPQKNPLQPKPDDPLVQQLAEMLLKNPDLGRQLQGMVKPIPSGGNQPDQSGPQETPDSKPPENAPPPNTTLPRGFPRQPTKPMPSPQLPDPSHQPRRWLAEIEKWVAKNPALQNSPAFRQVLEDLAHQHLQINPPAMGTGETNLSEKMAQWIGDRLPAESFWRHTVWSKVRNVPWPTLPHLQPPNLNFSKPSFPSLDGPSISLPAPPSSGGETLFFSLLTVAVVALVLWKLYGNLLRRWNRLQGLDWARGEAGLDGLRLNLSSLNSRQDLIRAFEQLSLVKLGPDARSWNHLHLAASLGGNETERRRMAHHLAFLYEQARYAPGDGPMPADALRIARRELALLAGVANA